MDSRVRETNATICQYGGHWNQGPARKSSGGLSCRKTNQHHNNEMWTLESKTDNLTQHANEIEKRTSQKPRRLQHPRYNYGQRGPVVRPTWARRTKTTQNRAQSEKNNNHYSDLAVATKCCGKKDKRRKYTELLYLNSQSTKVQKRAAVSLLVAPVLYPTLLRRCQFYVNPPATQWNVFHNVQLCTTLATKVLSDYWW